MRPYRKANEKWFKKEVEFIIQKSHCTNISRSVFYQTYAVESVNEDQIASRLSWWHYLICFIFSVQVFSNSRDLLLACLNLGKQWKDKSQREKCMWNNMTAVLSNFSLLPFSHCWRIDLVYNWQRHRWFPKRLL